MTTSLSSRKVEAGTKAGEMFGNGFHCAEAVAVAVLQALGEDAAEATAHATAFGGGVGESFQGDCGALAGALIAIGHLHGRREPGGDWALAATLGADIREHFIKDYKTAHCGALRKRFGKEAQMASCRRLVTGMSEMLMVRLATASNGG
jgi:C_GCAxxG_C_C family probable redox protein